MLAASVLAMHQAVTKQEKEKKSWCLLIWGSYKPNTRK